MYCLFEKTENKRKRGRGWHIFLNKDENRPIFVEVCECPFKINIMGPAYFYMEIAQNNCISETSPYNLSLFTQTTNVTNGVVNSAFAKISVPATPLSQWFDRDSAPYKFFLPPAERIRKLKIRLRYHNNELVDFGSFDYSFMLEFIVLLPTQTRTVTSVQRQF